MNEITKKELLEYIKHLRKLGECDVKLAKNSLLNTYDNGWISALDYIENKIKPYN